MAVNRPSAALAKAASEKDLNQISECIGSNWEMLAPFLIERNSTATVEQIKDDHRQSRQRVYYLLYKWRTQTDDPSLAHLFHSMYQAGTSVTIDWNVIADILKLPIQDIRACRTRYQRPETQQQQASGERMDVDIYEGDFRRIQHIEPMQGVQESRNSMGQFANNRQSQPLQGEQEIPQSVDDGHLGMDGGQTSVDGRHIRMDVDGGQPPVSRGQLSVDGGSVSRDQSSADGGQPPVSRGQSSVDGGQPPVSRGQSSLDGGQRSFKDACLYDGRLLKLTQDVIENLRRENIVEIGKGSFGKVYKSESKSEDFGIHVVVKKIPLRNDFIARTIRREMITSRILHPFILPLLAAVEPPLQPPLQPLLPDGERVFWFVSPMCENGDLYKVLEHDRLQQIPKLNGQKRVKILLQVALAIKYIHTKVPNVRAVIFHKDIASKNIVLDDMFNARLIDFGLAREENDMSTIAGGRLFYLHPNVGKESENESWDYYSFGVIVREMITTFGPEGQGPTHLKNMKAEYITHNIYKKIWEHDHLENAHEKLNDIATKLLEQTDWKVQDFTENVIEELIKLYAAFGQSCFLDVSKKRGQACHSCMINTKAKQTSMNQKHSDNCSQKIEVCMACEKNSFLNPITCYCGTKLTPTIGHRWAALLVAGKDTKDTNRVEISKALAKDVKELEKLLTSHAPRVFGISKSNVHTIVPSAPDKLNDGEKLWPEVKDSISYFSQRTDIDTMLIYISCHGARSNGSGDTNYFQFQLGSSPEDSITLDQFDKELERLGNIGKLIIVLDRCYPPLVKLEKMDSVYIQMNSCKPDQKAQMDNDGSLFTRFFIRGLKAKSQWKKCQGNCQPCIDYLNRSKDFITVHNLFDYIKGHLSGQTPVYVCHLYDQSNNIAFYTGDKVEISFSHENSCPKSIPLEHLKTIEELEKILKDKFCRNETDEVCIQKDTFRKDGDQVCDTIDKVMLAWTQRQPLYVTFNS